MTLYLFLNCGLFFAYFGYVYADAAKRLALGLGAPLAKGCAGILYLNIPLSFLTMSRTFMTWARTSKLKYLIPFDHATLFHQIVGGVIVLASTGHISGHLISTFRNAAKVDDLVALNSVVENFTFKSLPTYTWLIFQSGPGMSGVIITLALILLTVTALPSVRKRHFNLFWYTHHLFVVFTGALFAHGTWQYVQFPHMVFYLGIPFLWYVWERVLRWYRAVFVLYEVSLITIQPERTIRIQLTPKNKTCNYRPGQYVYVNFPNIARFEWHPYTLTSSPLEQNLVIYIRANGNWSNEVVRLAKNDPEALSSVRIDGPFGAPAEHFGDFKNIMLIGTGIGVTPFAGILRDMQIKVLERNETMSKLQRVDLYWVNRSRGAFTWFVQLLRDLEQPKTQSMIRVHTFITSANSSRDIRSVLLWKGLSLLRNESNSSVLTGLAREAYWGRPDWELIFEQTAAKFSGGTVGVFFCGPEVLAEELWQLARKKSASTRCRFVFRMENF
ncbi:ferric reductase NAD binding domain-containing protein [Phlyctochytrium arcticum]|nr:ferric reductase NAD binding domain-containing protein [Phlyctochytrium arcticum]